MEERIASVTLFANGEVMTFAPNGEQIPEYQGHYDDVRGKIRAVYKGLWSFGVYQRWVRTGLSFADIEFTVQQLKASWQE